MNMPDLFYFPSTESFTSFSLSLNVSSPMALKPVRHLFRAVKSFTNALSKTH